MEIQVLRQMAVSPARVMRALTEPVEVAQWAGALLQIDEATYRLTGASLVMGGLGGRLVERTPTSLRFAWELAGQESVVEIRITPVAQSGNPPATWSEVSLLHQGVPEGLVSPDEQETWFCIWVMLLRFLRSWVERGERLELFRFDGPFPALVEREILLAAPTAKVWRALVEPDLRRRWIDEVLGEILAQEEGRMLTFDFPLAPSTQVRFELEPIGTAQTRLRLRHEGLRAEGLGYHLGWYDYLVSCYLETAEPQIGLALWFGAPLERLWPLISTQAGLRQWFNQQMEFEPVVGGRVWFQSHGSGLYGEVTKIEPGRLIAFTWSEEGVAWPAPTLLIMELQPEAGGTLLKITHSGFGPLPEKEFASYRRGWADDSWVLESIRTLVE